MKATAGETLVFPIRCRRYVDEVEQLYDPTTLTISVLLSDGYEDALTYGGSETGDNAVIRNSTGYYELRYVVPAGVEFSKIRVKTTDLVQSISWPAKSIELAISIDSDPHAYADTPVTP